MPLSRESLEAINGAEALAQLDAVRAQRAEHSRKTHEARVQSLGDVAMEHPSGVVPVVNARLAAEQARVTTGEVPVVPVVAPDSQPKL